jgi:hypothetical protein
MSGWQWDVAVDLGRQPPKPHGMRWATAGGRRTTGHGREMEEDGAASKQASRQAAAAIARDT